MSVLYCSNCGCKYDQPESEWPKVCTWVGCKTIRYLNPSPVVCLVQPIRRTLSNPMDIVWGAGILRRAIAPKIGEWACPAGFMNVGESAEECARRELREETQLELKEDAILKYSRPIEDNKTVLVMLSRRFFTEDEWMAGVLDHENTEIGVLWEGDPIKLAFPVHEEAVAKLWAGDFSDDF